MENNPLKYSLGTFPKDGITTTGNNISDKELKEILTAFDQAFTGKPQIVRLFDVFIFGPLIIKAASKAKGLTRFERRVIRASGWGTIIFNGWNYFKIAYFKKWLKEPSP